MSDKKQYRRFFTDSEYRASIEQEATRYLEAMVKYNQLPVDECTNKEDYYPAVDNADIAAGAVLTELSRRAGTVYETDHAFNHEMTDMVAAIIRQGMLQTSYEQTPIDPQENDMAKDNSAKTLSIDDVGKTANAYEEIPTMTNMEQVQIVAECAYRIGDHWANHPNSNLGTTERVMGAVHGVLDMFQNGSPDIVPPFILIPVDPETDTGAMTSLQRNGNWTEVDWNYNEPMYLEVDRHLKNEPAYSLTGKFEEQYEIHRERYRTAAIDLFKP